MRARLAAVAAIFAFSMLGGATVASAETDSLASGGICLDGSQPYNGRCCVDHDCRSSYPAIGGVPSIPPPTTRSTPLSGAEQSETSAGDPDGTGNASLVLYPAKAQVCFTISHANVNPTNAGHVHLGARGQSGGVVVNLYTSLGVSSSISGCVPADPVTIIDIINNPTKYYVQLHNAGYPLGVIRGQLGD